MRLTNLSTKSFKSINALEDREIYDTKITSIIGKNGSGKSNILHAINALKDTSKLTDSDRYEKIDKDNEIFIQASFKLEEHDKSLFEDTPIDFKDLDGFIVTVSKKVGEEATINYTPRNFDKKTSEEVIKEVGLIVKKILKVDIINDDQKEQIINSFNLIKEKIDNNQVVGSVPEVVVDIENIINILEPTDKEKELTERLEFAKKVALFEITLFIRDVLWPKLSINLLTLDDYPIKTRVNLEEVNNGKHLFEQDILDLIQFEIEDFRVEGEDLSNNKKDASEKFNIQLNSVWKEKNLKFVIDVQSGFLMIFFITPQNRRRKLDDLSDGEKWFLGFYTRLAVAQQRNQQVLWLFDEPGQHLHASAQHDLQRYFEEISKISQIFYTTHQPMMIPWHRLERILVAENNKGSGTILSEKIWKDSEVISPLREALGLFVGEGLLTGKEHVIVEGPSDYIYMLGWLIFFQNTLGEKTSFWKDRFSSSERVIVPAGGVNNIPLYLLFLTNKTKRKVSTIAIPDTKELSEDIKEYINDKGLNPLVQKVFSFEEIVKNTENRSIKDIEDLFNPVEWLVLFKKFYLEHYDDVDFPKNFENPAKSELKNGVIDYVKKFLSKENVNKAKVGIAFEVYKKLVSTKVNPYSKQTRKRFLNVYKEIDRKFPKGE